MQLSKKWLPLCLLAFTLLTQSAAQAHFPWLVREDDGRVSFFFGEGLTDRTYKLPPSLAAAKLMRMMPSQEPSDVAMQPVEQDDFVGLRTEMAIASDATLASQATFGIYHGARLDYYAVYQGGPLPTNRDASQTLQTGLELSAELIDTDSGVDVYATWQGQPLVDVKVHLYCADGHEEGTATTDAAGKVSFGDAQVEDGLNAIMLGHKVPQAGQLGEVAYDTQAHYLTVTFVDPKTAAQPAPVASTDTSVNTNLPPLPIEITSFGAARQGSSLYVYGGHMGDAHSYSTDAQNDKLLQLDLAQPQAGWQELSTGPRLQGLGMVAHGQRLILLGGFTAQNEAGAAHDLHSQANCRVFDLASGQWSELPALPEPRSSHDAALIGDTIYVVGGWNLQGEGDATWHTTAWSMNLAEAQPQWIALPQPPFSRRAVATVAHAEKLFVIGGMNKIGGPTKAVVVFDPLAQQWTEVAALHGQEAIAGFGASGWSLNGKLLVTTYEGDIERWNDVSSSWELVGKTADARFFHRMLPADDQHLVSIGGANMQEGKYTALELVEVK